MFINLELAIHQRLIISAAVKQKEEDQGLVD
jgi:hypothetical protein